MNNFLKSILVVFALVWGIPCFAVNNVENLSFGSLPSPYDLLGVPEEGEGHEYEDPLSEIEDFENEIYQKHAPRSRHASNTKKKYRRANLKKRHRTKRKLAADPPSYIEKIRRQKESDIKLVKPQEFKRLKNKKSYSNTPFVKATEFKTPRRPSNKPKKIMRVELKE